MTASTQRMVSFAGQDRRRWCAVCGTQRGTQRGRFVEHWKPNSDPKHDPPCPYSGQPVDAVEQAGENRQTKIGTP